MEKGEKNMIFEFSKMEDTVIPNFYGGEKHISAKMHVDDNLKLMKGTLIPGASIGVHTHENNSEVVFALSGEAEVTMDGKTEILKPGTVHYCPMGHSHGMANKGTEDFVMYAVVPNHKL